MGEGVGEGVGAGVGECVGESVGAVVGGSVGLQANSSTLTPQRLKVFSARGAKRSHVDPRTSALAMEWARMSAPLSERPSAASSSASLQENAHESLVLCARVLCARVHRLYARGRAIKDTKVCVRAQVRGRAAMH